MFTIQVEDEQVYRRLMAAAAAHGGSVDEALRAMLPVHRESRSDDVPDGDLTPAQRFLRLLEANPLEFQHPFPASEAEEILRTETGQIDWREDSG